MIAARAAALAIVFAPEIASACAVCFSGRSDETRVAFIATTALMTAMPLLLVGGLIWWLRRRWLRIQQLELESRLDRAPDARPRPSEVTS